MRQAIQEPDGRLLYVPVRSTGCGAITLRTGRLASGERIGLAFTSEAALAATLGAGQAWIILAGRLVPAMFAEAGVSHTRIDPLPAAASTLAPTPAPAPTRAPVQLPRPVATATLVDVSSAGLPPSPSAPAPSAASDSASRPRRVRTLTPRRPSRHRARPTALRHAC